MAIIRRDQKLLFPLVIVETHGIRNKEKFIRYAIFYTEAAFVEEIKRPSFITSSVRWDDDAIWCEHLLHRVDMDTAGQYKKLHVYGEGELNIPKKFSDRLKYVQFNHRVHFILQKPILQLRFLYELQLANNRYQELVHSLVPEERVLKGGDGQQSKRTVMQSIWDMLMYPFRLFLGCMHKLILYIYYCF